MSKGKHRKKQKISISFLVILLLSVCFFSTGIIIGGQLTKHLSPKLIKETSTTYFQFNAR